MTDEPKKIKCLRCKIDKTRKEYQRDSKEYKSCNDCCLGSQRMIDKCFDHAALLFDARDRETGFLE